MIHEIDELSNAIELATRAHYCQKDKVGEPYIFQSLRVMMTFKNKDSRIAAILKDVIECSELTLEDLDEAGFSDAIIHIVGLLTQLPDENYFDYLDKIKKNEIALAVKIADIQDNINRLSELYRIDRNEARKLDRKYSEAMRFLRK